MPGPFYFAWCGGQIQPQVTVGTSGNTHGGVIEQLIGTGDTDGLHGQVHNLNLAGALSAGDVCQIAGPGIPSGAFFVFAGDTTINLSHPPSADHLGVTLTITKPVVIANTVGTFAAGGNSVTLQDVSALIAGEVYGIFSTALGYWTDTSGTHVAVSGNAAFTFHGSATVDLSTVVFVETDLRVDVQTGLPFVQGSSQSVSVKAYAGGAIEVVIKGFHQPDPELVDVIPAADLAGLTAGLRYNFSGPGIPAGATFVAPASPATSIELDRAATQSGVSQAFVISGPRTPSEPFDPAKHGVEDELVLGFTIQQAEGDFATLTIDLKNPDVGLLSAGRNLWCWLSWDQAWGTGNPVDLVPLLNGRLVGIPRRQANEIVQLDFLARPEDYFVQKEQLAAQMSVLPWWDPVWLSPQEANDPDKVLEARSELWHIDRTSLELTASDILVGEDGIITIAEDQHFYDAFNLAINAPPLTAITLNGTISYTQRGSGRLDITGKMCDAFRHAGSPKSWASATSGGGGLISMLVGDSLKDSWPRGGTAIGGGWSVTPGNDYSGTPWNYIVNAVHNNAVDGGWIAPLFYNVQWTGFGPTPDPTPLGPTPTDIVMASGYGGFVVSYPVSVFKIRFFVDWVADRRRTESISVVMTADVQQAISDPAGQDTEQLSLTSEVVDQAVEPGGGVPLADLRLPSYFQTGRGQASFEHMLLIGRAKLRERARAVDINFETDFRTALGITLRHSVNLLDRRMPGGSVTGKVKKYTLSVGEQGMLGSFTIGCSIGRGTSAAGTAGDGVYAAPGYMAPGYQVMTGEQAELLTGEIYYTPFSQFAIADDGLNLLNLTPDNAINALTVVNGLQSQVDKLATSQNAFLPTYGVPTLEVGRQIMTVITLDLKPVAGSEFTTKFAPAVTPLALPKTIDLEAEG